MKITKSQLKRIIKEELGRVKKEGIAGEPIWPTPEGVGSEDAASFIALAMTDTMEASFAGLSPDIKQGAYDRIFEFVKDDHELLIFVRNIVAETYEETVAAAPVH